MNAITVRNMITTERACSWYICFTSSEYGDSSDEEAEEDDADDDSEIEFFAEEAYTSPKKLDQNITSNVIARKGETIKMQHR